MKYETNEYFLLANRMFSCVVYAQIGTESASRPNQRTLDHMVLL